MERGDEVLPFTIVPKAEGRQQVGEAGIGFRSGLSRLHTLEKDMPGFESGMKLGDQILSWTASRSMPPAPCRLICKVQGRAGTTWSAARRQEVELTVKPQLNAAMERHPATYRIGFGSAPTQIEKLPTPEAFGRSLDECRRMTSLVFS